MNIYFSMFFLISGYIFCKLHDRSLIYFKLEFEMLNAFWVTLKNKKKKKTKTEYKFVSDKIMALLEENEKKSPKNTS